MGGRNYYEIMLNKIPFHTGQISAKKDFSLLVNKNEWGKKNEWESSKNIQQSSEKTGEKSFS